MFKKKKLKKLAKKVKKEPLLNLLEGIDWEYKQRYRESTPEGLLEHVRDEMHELENAFMLEPNSLRVLEEGWDVIFMVFGFMRSIESYSHVIHALEKTIEKNIEKIKEWDKR